MKIILTLTQAGTEKIIHFIDRNYQYFPDELEGPIAPQTYRADPSFWHRAFEFNVLGKGARDRSTKYIKWMASDPFGIAIENSGFTINGSLTITNSGTA